jgi:hypothetical protein
MTIQDMHYDFKTRLNKLDSNQYRNLLIPEIDRKLNEAAYIFVKSIANPRLAKEMGLEMNHRTIDDIRTLVVDALPLSLSTTDNINFFATIPSDYMFYINSSVKAKKGSCEGFCETVLRKHVDRHSFSPFDTSSFEWREVNIHFVGNSIRVFTDGTFNIEELYLDYLTTMPYMHFANGFPGNTYTLPDGVALLGTQDCILPEQVHTEIVDLAVLIASGEINANDYQLKISKVQLNQ